MQERIFPKNLEDILKRKCALMGCDIEEGDDETLGELLNSKAAVVRAQARSLIKQFGFEESDILCPDCFWK
jgi:hypothetical protein